MTLAPHLPPFHDHPFSIASAATDLPRLRLVIRESGDCTNDFGRVRPGTRVAIDGPHGSFVLPEGKTTIVMIAGGVGIAPLLGMLEEAAANDDTRPFRLLYAARSPAALAALERLRELQLRLDLVIHCVVDDRAEGSNYSVGPICRDHVSLSLAGVQPEGVTALVCGPAGMMEFATDALLASGVPASSISLRTLRLRGGKRIFRPSASEGSASCFSRTCRSDGRIQLTLVHHRADNPMRYSITAARTWGSWA